MGNDSSYSVAPEDKKLLIKSLYDAANDKTNPRSKLSYIEIKQATGLDSSKILGTGDILVGEKYLSKFSAKDAGIISFGLSDVLMSILDKKPDRADKIIEEISYKSSVHRI